MSDLNMSAIRKHALACSAAKRGGRFTRVGQDFIDEVEADVEALIRRIAVTGSLVDAPILTQDTFTTGALLERVKGVLNIAVARIIESKIQRLPSVGCTLGRSR